MLPATRQLIHNACGSGFDTSSVRLLVVQHLRDDTAEFIGILLDHGFTITKVIGIEYSSDSEPVRRIQEYGIEVIVPAFRDLEATVDQALTSELSANDLRTSARLLIQEVGGYCAHYIRHNPDALQGACRGIVEETKRGLWNYQDIDSLPIPILSIADARLKVIEARHVGLAVARAVESDVLETGCGLHNSAVGVLGFGDIGSSVAVGLLSRGATVSIYDADPIRAIDAKMQGFALPRRAGILAESDVIVGACGSRSMSFDDLLLMRDAVMLASASSKCIEFPIDQIESVALGVHQLSDHISEYAMPWGKAIRLAAHGFPVNFRSRSLPVPMSDLLFCQIAKCLLKLAEADMSPIIHRLSDDEEKSVARLWLEHYAT